MNKRNYKRPLLKWSFFSVLSGILSGIAATAFLHLLDTATHTRDHYPFLIWFLPIAGFFIGWVYFHYGEDIARGNNLILEEIHDPKKVIPVIMAPFILFGTVITHLFGGSAGREGTAVQMGASLSDQLARFFKVEAEERKILLIAGAGAGFGAAIGTPWAGVFFGMEVIQVGKLNLFAFIECLIASFTAYYTTLLLKAPHSHYPKPIIESFHITNFFWIAIAGIIFGLTARLFSLVTHLIEKLQSKFISYPPLKPFFAGIVLVTLYAWEGSYRYVGLGIPVIQDSLEKASTIFDPVYKILFTALTVGSGFKGGEFIPLVFIGSTLGSALSQILPVSFGLLAATGFAAVFAGASNTPLACTIMAIEVFGLPIAPYAAIACYLSYYFSGHPGIYATQIKKDEKYHRLRKTYDGIMKYFS